jgi:hypothetical protein
VGRTISKFLHCIPVLRERFRNCLPRRARRARLEDWRTERMAQIFYEVLERDEQPLPEPPREEFAQRLRLQMESAASRKAWVFRLPKITLPELPKMDPTLTTGVVLSVAAAVLFLVWVHQRTPNITSNALLVRAENWEDGSMAPRSGVILQKVQITMRGQRQAMNRTIYRDAQGKRRLKEVKLAMNEERLRQRLSIAGVDWDEPLSATAYQNWHDHQRVRTDQIKRSGNETLTLTTTVPSGDIAEQSITVRETDFHPVLRTVAFRDSETVELAELDYQVLPWTAAYEDMFRPDTGSRLDGSARPQPFVVPLPPSLPTEDQLDEAELGVRLVLNQLQADTGEQIRIERSPSGIEVKGLVETNQRKRELSEQLRMIPRVKASILSIEELQQSNDAAQPAESLKVTSVAAQPSPLETYFVKQGRDAAALRTISQQLLSDALTASQESRSISDLLNRFAAGDKLTSLGKGTLTALVFSHRQKLMRAIEEEQALLDGLSPGLNGGKSADQQSMSLVDVAARNLTLCEELSLGSRAQPRSAESILSDLTMELSELRASAHRTLLQPGAAENAKAAKNRGL